MKKQIDTDEEETPETSDADQYLPALIPQDYSLEPFTPVHEADGDTPTTESDLQFLNNHLALCNGLLPHLRTLDGLCQLSNTVCKLIETRRKVKKLEFGAPQKAVKGTGFITLD